MCFKRWLNTSSTPKEKGLFWMLFAVSAFVEIFVRYNNFFLSHPWVDFPMHFLWGITFYLGFTRMFSLTHAWGFVGVTLWQALWEAGEEIGDVIIAQPAYMQDYFFWNGFLDTTMNLLGAVFAYGVLRYMQNKK